MTKCVCACVRLGLCSIVNVRERENEMRKLIRVNGVSETSGWNEWRINRSDWTEWIERSARVFGAGFLCRG